MDMDFAIRLAALQQRVFRCIEDELRKDGGHKSYEGAMELSLSLPNIFEQERGPRWTLTLSAYVLDLDGRHQSWSGKTPAEALAIAEYEIGKICQPYEMARFERDMGMCEDEPGEADGNVTIFGDPRPTA